MKVKNLKDLGIVVIETDLTLEALGKLAKHNAKALELRDANGEITFKIACGPEASISKYGIVFNKKTTAGNAALFIEEALTKEQIAENYSVALNNLKAIEEQAAEAYANLVADLTEVIESITEEPEMEVTE